MIASAVTFSVFTYYSGNLLIAGLGFLASLYLVLQTYKISRQIIVLDDESLIYGNQRIPYKSIKNIKCIDQSRTTTGDILFNILGNSSIYIIVTDSRDHQILGKMYAGIGPCMELVAKHANITLDRVNPS